MRTLDKYYNTLSKMTKADNYDAYSCLYKNFINTIDLTDSKSFLFINPKPNEIDSLAIADELIEKQQNVYMTRVAKTWSGYKYEVSKLNSILNNYEFWNLSYQPNNNNLESKTHFDYLVVNACFIDDENKQFLYNNKLLTKLFKKYSFDQIIVLSYSFYAKPYDKKDEKHYKKHRYDFLITN